MAEAFVSLVLDGAVATVTMNRPERRNALSSTQDCDDFVDAFRQLEANASAVNCIVLTGAGRSFCAGGDLKTMKARQGIGRQHSPAETRENYRRGIQRVIDVLWNCEIPTIAAVNGNALGLGLDLACLCDIRIAADNATFASSFIKVGLIPGDGGAWILPRAVGLSRASEMIFTGDSIDAHAAHSLGLVSRIAPEDRLLSEALALARQIACKPARALRLAKRLIREGQHQRLADVLQLSAAFQALTHETKDHEEALDAFLEKRAPVFTGG